MHTAALLLIFFAVLMACWGFSVIVRSVSEWRFFRKYPKSTARKVGRWWSPLVGLGAMAASIYPCRLGLRWAALDSDIEIGWLYAVAAGIGVFGLWIGIVWAIGDRSRGRRRCTRCLYDLSGLTGLRCPECGREFRSEKHLFRAKRGRWACVVSLFLIAVSGFAFSRTGKVEEYGPLMLVPTPVLMAGWRWLPAPVIYSWNHDALEGSLEERLDYIDGLDWDARIRIADRLLSKMHRSESNRWNRRLASLIQASLDYRNLNDLEPEVAERIAALGRKHASLYDRIGVELAIAATTSPETLESRERLEFIGSWYMIQKHPYMLMQRLVGTNYIIRTPEEQGTYIDQILARRPLLPDTRAMLSQRSAEIILRDEPGSNQLLFEASLDSGFISDHLDALVPSQPFRRQDDVLRTVMWSRYALQAAPADARVPMLERMVRLVASPVPQESGMVLWMSSVWGQSPLAYGFAMPEPFRTAMLSAAIEHGLQDNRVPFPNIPDWKDRTVRSYAQDAIINLDPDGSVAMPLLREWVLNGDTSKHYGFWRRKETDLSTANWLEHLADLATHPDPKIRRWLSGSLPLAVGTPYDERVSAVIATLAEEPDEWTADNVRNALRARKPSPGVP